MNDSIQGNEDVHGTLKGLHGALTMRTIHGVSDARKLHYFLHGTGPLSINAQNAQKLV